MNAEQALALLELGFALLPLNAPTPTGCSCKSPHCAFPGKHPIGHLAPNGVHSATQDPHLVDSWFRTLPFTPNIGIATGFPSNVVVLDADGDRGVQHLLGLDPPPTLAVATPGKGGGLHLYFRHPGRTMRPRIRTVVPGLALDFLADGSYVLAPGSVHPNGGTYLFAADEPIADFQPWLSTLLDPRGPTTRAKPFELPEVIPAGERYRTLFRYACSLQAKGLDDQDIYRMVMEALPHCEQPLNDPITAHDAEKAVRDVLARYPKGGNAQHDELALVKRIQAELDDPDAKSIAVDGETYYFDRRAWRPLGPEGTAAFLHAWTNEPSDTATGMKPFRPTHMKILNVYKHMKLLRHAPNFFDGAPIAAGFSNGVLVPDGRLFPHSPEYRLRYCREYPYNPDATCPRWFTFLEQTFGNTMDAPRRIAALQEFAGAVLFSLAPKYAQAVLLLGPGANGKSVILDVLQALVPPDAVVSIQPHEMSNEYSRADLQKALLNVVTEMPLRELRDTEGIKAMIDGSYAGGRPIYGQKVYSKSRCAHIFAANLLPDTSDYTYSMKRRWLLLECPNVVPQHLRNPNLARDVLETELQGIIVWAIQGVRRLHAQGTYSEVPSSRQRIDEWAMDSNQVAQFINDCCHINGDVTPFFRLRQLYQFWAAGNGWKPLSSTRFASRLKETGIEKVERKDGPYYRLSLRKNTMS